MGMGAGVPQQAQGGKGGAGIAAPTGTPQASLGGKGLSPTVPTTATRPSTSVQQPSQVQQPVARPPVTQLPAPPVATPAQTAAPTVPQGFNLAQGNYRFGTGTVGRYDGQYVFRDPVTNQYLSTGNQAQAYLRAFGNNGNALTLPATGGFNVGQPIAQGMPQNTVTNAAGLMNRINPPTLPAFAGTRAATPFSKDQAKQLFNYGSQYAASQRAFNTLYDKFLEGTFRGEEAAPVLKYLQDYSRQAAEAQNQYNTLLGSALPQRPPAAGMPTPASPLALQTRFTLPQETWNMTPSQLASWINNYERQMGRDSFLGNAAWIAGPALIGGAAATGLTGIPMVGAPSLPQAAIHSGVGSAISTGTGMSSGLPVGTRRATGGLASLKKDYK